MTQQGKQITTAIPYMNGKVHIGNIMDQTYADAYARYYRMKGYDVQFLGGADEHGEKIWKKAQEVGIDVMDMLDQNVDSFQETMQSFSISFDRFIRTTDRDAHWSTVQDIWMKWVQNGDVYKKEFEGKYCVGCEAYKKDNELDEHGNCRDHLKKPKVISEVNWFFRLSRYEKWLRLLLSEGIDVADVDRLNISTDMDAIRRNAKKVQFEVVPGFRNNEMFEFMRDGLQDVSFSREKNKMPWGIPVPGDPDQVMYIWADALLNYVSGLGYTDNPKKFEQFGSGAFLQVLGKDVARFHLLYYPAMLKSAGLISNQKVLVHGHITSGGQKMSKSLGNVISPIELREVYGADAVKYFIASSGGVNEDVDFTPERFHAVYTELGNSYGNLVNRVILIALKAGMGGWVKQGSGDRGQATEVYMNYEQAIEAFDTPAALEVIDGEVRRLEKYLFDQEPWKLEDHSEEFLRIMSECLDSTYHITLMLSPFMPKTAEKVWKALGLKKGDIVYDPGYRYTAQDFVLSKPEILFPKVDAPVEEVKELAPLQLTVDSGVEAYVVVKELTIPGSSKKQSKAFKSYLENVFADWTPESISDNIEKYHTHLASLGIENPVCAVQNLLNIYEKSGKLPNINKLVDCYNVISLTHGIGFGVHDADLLPRNVSLQYAQGGERFDAMFGAEIQPIQPGEIILSGVDGIDDGGNVRAYGRDIRQSEQSKVSENTRNVLIYAQGAPGIEKADLQKALDAVVGNIERFIQA